MNLSRLALAGACLALPAALAGGALAQPADGTRVIQVPPGAVVLILGASDVAAPPQVITSAQDSPPLMRLIARREAMMQRMMADMTALFPPMPDPMQMIRTAMAAAGQPGGSESSAVTVTSIGAAPGICGESVSYTFNGNDARPVVHVTRYGDACGTTGTQPVRQLPQAPAHADQPNILDVGYPPHPALRGVPPRT